MKITNHRSPMTLDQIQATCPSAFTAVSAPHVSSAYTHIPTSQVVEDMITLGWTPVSAQQVKARKGIGFQKHIIRFQNQNIFISGDDNDNVFPELLLTNSHDGKNAFHLRVGLYRLVCSNGLVVADAEFSNVAIRHTGYTFEELRTQVVALIDTLPGLVEKINVFRATPLTQEQMEEFATRAAEYRWKKQTITINPQDILAVERNQDNGSDLWSVFNRVQEKLTNGGFNYSNGRKVRKVRALKNFTQDLVFNGELWELAETYIN